LFHITNHHTLFSVAAFHLCVPAFVTINCVAYGKPTLYYDRQMLKLTKPIHAYK